ncbi:ABC transporter ATP-binding protein [Chlorobium phaeovibrioides]|uniref:ABC transporter ATP-binding protein n=1 Tax=Chlorobium phaeovibrioides TaxID=1094 RepID=A0A5M8IAM7_CHLPH|nr:ABC transporter ATP-binding protein [Chlorobium phaeovibrioides]KAA6232493.1 ABC transporter ATP-binding protein [Chlorobium phaeovibrioides]
MKSAVEVKGVTKKFKTVTALSNVSLTVGKGELFGIIGADGAGKTTLFRILCTLMLADEGRAEVLGFDARKEYRSIRSRIGYMPGRFSLYTDLSVEENLKFFATVFNTTVEENYELIADIYTQLEPFKKRMAGQLSGGMKQKLALCCALIHRPDLLLLDEPTTGVDAVSRREFWQMLGRLKEQGITILVSTPYMDEASLCDRVAFLQDGTILAVDTPVGITGLFTAPLFAVRANEKHKLLTRLRSYPHAKSVYAFGSSVHYADHRPSVSSEEILRYLSESELQDITIERIEPGIEDTFMALMKTDDGSHHE